MKNFFKEYMRVLFLFSLSALLLSVPSWALWALCSALYGWPWVPYGAFLSVLLAGVLLIQALRILWTLTTKLGSDLMSAMADWLL